MSKNQGCIDRWIRNEQGKSDFRAKLRYYLCTQKSDYKQIIDLNRTAEIFNWVYELRPRQRISEPSVESKSEPILRASRSRQPSYKNPIKNHGLWTRNQIECNTKHKSDYEHIISVWKHKTQISVWKHKTQNTEYQSENPNPMMHTKHQYQSETQIRLWTQNTKLKTRNTSINHGIVVLIDTWTEHPQNHGTPHRLRTQNRMVMVVNRGTRTSGHNENKIQHKTE